MKPAPVVYWVNRWTWQVWPKAQLVYIGGAANCGKMRDSKQLHTVASSSTLSQAAPHCRKQLHTVASSSTLSQAAPHCRKQLHAVPISYGLRPTGSGRRRRRWIRCRVFYGVSAIGSAVSPPPPSSSSLMAGATHVHCARPWHLGVRSARRRRKQHNSPRCRSRHADNTLVVSWTYVGSAL